ncbi:LysR family transcriptional regulator [Sphingomonas sp. CFBP 13603]|uniref:LysR family transcriptional regulator n=1 Tax=Sphingomonas sp. CFBP 13603 TaxID=2774040 RepID=UPI0018688B7A|nr:LysR family transcriptional regulator [Sphingomonas sp. CFBP 13603]MBE2992261.1 LysR family transcriptional regulator [Sphingomonas sp. CFBP 13603]
MNRDDLVDLNAFMAVAAERSFTRAAAKLGTSQSALSHTVRRLETRLGVRLLTRTTRSVAPTTAGERLLATLTPALAMIDTEIASLSDLRDKPRGLIRLTTSEHAAETVLLPALAPFLAEFPDIQVELSIDSGLTDIVTDQFDAGVRLGEALAKDTIAVRISPDLRMAVVGSPEYFDHHPACQTPQNLAQHNCINLRLRSAGGLYAWELEKGDREIRVRVDGQMSCNNTATIIRAAVRGVGLGFVMESSVVEHIANGKLVRMLEDWCPPFAGYHLYYPSRRQPSAAFALLVEALRHRQ